MAKKATTSPRTQPQRSCVACGRTSAKAGFVRFVRGTNGFVACDASGRAPGRGAYLCAQAACFAEAEKRGRLARALKCSVTEEDYRRLEKEFISVVAERA